jgi:hypothetical protein
LERIVPSDFQPKLNVLAAAVCPTNDDFLVVFHKTQGLGLLDMTHMRLVLMDLTFPSDVTAFDSDVTRLFEYHVGKLRICDFDVKSFKIVSETLMMVKAGDGIVKFIDIEKFQPLSYFSRFLPPPAETQRLRDFVRYRPSKAYSRFACDAWLTTADRANMRIHATAGGDPPGVFERLYFSLLDRISGADDYRTNLKFVSLLFLDKFEEAAQLQHRTEAHEPDFLRQSLLSAYLLLTENPIDDRARILLKASAMRLFSVGKWEDGVMFMRIGRLDKEAVDFLANAQKNRLAVRFIRSTIGEPTGRAPFSDLAPGSSRRGRRRRQSECSLREATTRSSSLQCSPLVSSRTHIFCSSICRTPRRSHSVLMSR